MKENENNTVWVLYTLGNEVQEEYDHKPTDDDILEYANFHKICSRRVRVSKATNKLGE